MFIDKALVMDEDLVLTATQDSTDTLDFGAASLDPGAVTPMFWVVMVTGGFTTGPELVVALEHSVDDAVWTQFFVTPAVEADEFLVPIIFIATPLPRGLKRYIKTTYTVSNGPLADGTISSFLSLHQVPYIAAAIF